MRKYIITLSIDNTHLNLFNGRFFDIYKKVNAFNLSKKGLIETYNYEDGIKKIEHLRRYYNRNYNKSYQKYNFKNLKLLRIK